MKHKEHVDKLLRDLWYEDWMDEEDFNELKDECLKAMGTTEQELSDQLEIGIQNGHSIEKQFSIIKNIFKK